MPGPPTPLATATADPEVGFRVRLLARDARGDPTLTIVVAVSQPTPSPAPGNVLPNRSAAVEPPTPLATAATDPEVVFETRRSGSRWP